MFTRCTRRPSSTLMPRPPGWGNVMSWRRGGWPGDCAGDVSIRLLLLDEAFGLSGHSCWSRGASSLLQRMVSTTNMVTCKRQLFGNLMFSVGRTRMRCAGGARALHGQRFGQNPLACRPTSKCARTARIDALSPRERRAPPVRGSSKAACIGYARPRGCEKTSSRLPRMSRRLATKALAFG